MHIGLYTSIHVHHILIYPYYKQSTYVISEVMETVPACSKNLNDCIFNSAAILTCHVPRIRHYTLLHLITQTWG